MNVSQASIEKKQKNLNIIVKKRKNKMEDEDYDKLKDMFDITRQYVIDNNLLLYGGTAINGLLSKENKFYKTRELPDYDFFSPNARKHAKELTQIYYKMGYKYSEMKSGSHYGTFKVYANFTAVADVTDIPETLYKKMYKNHLVTDIGAKCVPLNFLKMSMYLELSRPDGDISRWPKTFQRLTLLDRTFKAEYKLPKEINLYNNNIENVEIKSILNTVREYIIFRKLVCFGTYAFSYFYNNSTPIKRLSANSTFFDCLSENAQQTIDELNTILSNMYLIPKEELKLNLEKIDYIGLVGTRTVLKKHSGLHHAEFFPDHYTITLKNYKIISLFQTEACYSYFEDPGTKIRIASIDTMLSLYYAFLFSSRKYIQCPKIEYMIKYLINLQYKHFKSNKNQYRRFLTTCYGRQKQIRNLKLNKWKKIEENKNPKLKAYKPFKNKKVKVNKYFM